MYGTFPRRKDSKASRPFVHYLPADIEQPQAWPGYQQQPTTPTFPRGGYAPAYDAWGYANARTWTQQFQEPQPISYHPLLATKEHRQPHSPASDNLFFDVRYMEAYDAEYRRLFDPASSVPAFQPSQTKIRLMSKDIPWSISVRNDKGITVRDILVAIFTELQQSILESEYWLATDADRNRMVKAYEASMVPKIGSGITPRSKDEGVKRVDFLGTKTEFAGIKPALGGGKDEAFAKKRLMADDKGLDGVWIMKFRDAEDD